MPQDEPTAYRQMPFVIPAGWRAAALIALFGCALTGRSSAQAPAGADIGAAALRAHVAALADDRMEGRETGTRGFERAATYVRSEFSRLHLQPIVDDYFEPFAIRRARVREKDTSLAITINGQTRTLAYGEDFVSYGTVRSTVLHAAGPLVYAGYGVTASASRRDDYANIDARGAIVAASLDTPAGLDPMDEALQATLSARVRNAATHGAAAIIFFDAEAIPWELRVRAARQLGATAAVDDIGDSPNLPVLIVKRDRREPLLRDPVNASARLTLSGDIREVRSENVVAAVKGREDGGEYIAFIAHLDHVGVGVPVRGDRVYNGAVDNASGVAALLAIARAFSHGAPPRRSILFLATTGEEQGEIGSGYFVRHGLRSVGRVGAAINMDGASIVPFAEAEIAATPEPLLRLSAEHASQQLGVRTKIEGLDAEGSDHAPFLRAGVPTLWVHAALPDGWMDARYHTPKDDLDQPLDFDAMATFTRLAFLIGSELANAPR